MANPPEISCPAYGAANQAQNTACSRCGLPLSSFDRSDALLAPVYQQMTGNGCTSPTVPSEIPEQSVDLISLAGYRQTPGYAPSTVPPVQALPTEKMTRKPVQTPSKHGISRRTVIIGLVSVGVATTAGITLYALAQTGVFPPSLALFTYRGHSDEVTSVDWSPRGKRIVSTSYDSTAQIWEPLTGKQFVIFRGHNGVVQDAAWSPDGSRVASCGGMTIQIWDANKGNVFLTYQGHTQPVNAVAWSPDGKRIASVSENVQIWDASSGKRFYAIENQSGAPLSNIVAWSPDGKRIASASGSVPTGTTDNTVQVFDATTGNNAYTYTGHSGPVTGVTWSPDGKYLSSSSVDKTVQIWRAP